MKKILYIHHGMGIGGAPLSLLYLLRKLDKNKYDPVVLCLYKSEAADLYRKEGIETIIAKGIYEFSHTYLCWINIKNCYLFIPHILFFIPSILKTFFLVKKLSPDIVHLNSSTLLPCAMGAKMARRKVVWHIREPLHHGYFGLRKRFLRWGIDRFSDRVIAICRNDADQLIQSDKIRIIYNFVDFEKFNRIISGEPFRNEFGIKDEKVAGMLGGVAETKGTMEFVKAAGLVQKNISKMKFFIVGELPAEVRGVKGLAKKAIGLESYFKRIKDFISREKLERSVIFTGVRTDIPEVIAGLDLIVFPSIVPHFARPIIEASAMGKPVIASDIGGPKELIINGVTGKLCPLRDINALAEAMVEILTNNEVSKKMGEAGYKFARDNFDADKNAKDTFLLYEEIQCKPSTI